MLFLMHANRAINAVVGNDHYDICAADFAGLTTLGLLATAFLGAAFFFVTFFLGLDFFKGFFAGAFFLSRQTPPTKFSQAACAACPLVKVNETAIKIIHKMRILNL